jgi:hypothetical protein
MLGTHFSLYQAFRFKPVFDIASAFASSLGKEFISFDGNAGIELSPLRTAITVRRI